VLAVVDPQTNRIVAGIDVGSKPVSVAAGEGAVWVGDARDGTVTRIDPASRRAVRTIGIGAPAVDLAAGGGSVWAATGGFGVITRIDPRLGAVSGHIDLHRAGDPVVPLIASVGVAGGRLWVGAFNGLVRIDPRSGRITGRVRLGHSPGLQLALNRGSVWATLLDRRARRVDAGSVRPTAQFYAGTLAVAIARDRSALWLAGADDGALWKLDPDTGATLLTSRGGTGASALALGSGSLWVASFRDDTLVRLDERTGQPQATIPLPGSPQDLAVADGLVWVALQAPD
jgi:streptogramin lyase